MNLLRKSIQIALYGVCSVPVFSLAENTQIEQLDVIELTVNKEDVPTEQTESYTGPASSISSGLSLTKKETPQSVTVVTQQQIRDQNLTTLTKALKNTVGVSTSQYDRGRDTFFSRGFAIDRYQVDGLSVNWPGAYGTGEANTDSVLFDRIEVVRGATGLMTGVGNPSASVNLVRKHADSTSSYTIFETGLASHNRYKGMIDHSQSLNRDASVRGRLVASYERGDTFVEREKDKRYTLYAVVDADFTQNTKGSIGVSYQKLDRDGVMWGNLPPFIKDTKTGMVYGSDWAVDKSTSPSWTYWNSQNFNYFANIEHKFNDKWKIGVKANQRVSEGDSKLFYLSGQVVNSDDGLGWSPSPNFFRTDAKQSTAQIQVDGNFDLWGLDHDIAFGVSYDRHNRTAFGGNWRTIVSAPISSFFNWDNGYAEPSDWGALSKSYHLKTIEKALYGSTRLKLTKDLSLIFGSRLSSYQSASSVTSSSNYKIHSEWTPYVGLVYNFTENQSLYTSYTNIFKPQEYFDSNNNVLDPVTGKSYEFGWKGNFLNNSLETQISVFRTEQDNLAQSTGQTNATTGLAIYRAVDGAVVKGFEVEVAGNITPDFKLSAGYSLWKGKDNQGNDVNTTYPTRQFKLFATYNLYKLAKGLTIGAGVNWQNRTYSTSSYGNVEQRAFTLVNVMARYQFNEHFSAQLNVDNLFNKKYRNALGGWGYNYGEPRYVSLNLRYEF